MNRRGYMIKKLIMVCTAMTLAIPAFANRGGGIKIEVKDLKSAESRARVADKVAMTLRDLGAQRVSSEISRAINEQSGRFDVQSQTKFARSLESLIEAVRVHNTNKNSNIQISKVETYVETVLSAAIAIKNNSTQNAKTQEIADLMFSFIGSRLKEKLENENLEYSLNKMQKAAEIVLTSNLSKRSIDEKEIETIYAELLTLFKSKSLLEVENC